MVVDDHKLVREGVRMILDNDASMEVVGDTDNGRSAVQMALQLLPHVVIIDLSMPEMNGIDAIRQIKVAAPEVKTLALTMHYSRQFVTESLGAGASGYLLKDSTASELIAAIKAVAGGAVYLSSKVMRVIADDYQQRTHGTQAAAPELLSVRERQVLQLVAEGKNTKEIAFILDVSIKTVEAYRAQIMKRLHFRSIADMIKYAIREGITTLE
jgi:DNA-binding NarL/FixJ family response regulator